MSRQYVSWSLIATAIMVLGVAAGFVAVPASAHPATPTSALPHTAPPFDLATLDSSPASSHVPISDERLAEQKAVLTAQRASGIAQRDFYPPNFLGGATVKNGVVSPLYTASPSPTGIGDFGVANTTGTAVGSVTDTRSWEGSTTLNSASVLYLDNDGPDDFGGQLNTVVTNVSVNDNAFNTSRGVYWIQDVYFYEPSTQEFLMIDNIWNFSSPTAGMPTNSLAEYGGFPSGSYYWDEYVETAQVPMPFTVNLWTNSSVTNFTGLNPKWGTTYEDPTISFGFQIITGGKVLDSNPAWDTVLFNSTLAPAPTVHVPLYQVNGVHLNPTGYLLYDAELMLGGPGGGSTVTFNAFNGTMQLRSWDNASHSWIDAPTVWTTGTDTGETSEGIAEHYTTAGTMILEGGPSIIMPMWGATPGPGPGGSEGNIGTLTLSGTLAPENAFIFVNRGGSLNAGNISWAPVLPGGSYSYRLPPGNYTGVALMSNYDGAQFYWNGTGSSTATNDIALANDPAQGIYTPLYAWNNAELALLATSGAGTAASPYIITGAQYQLISPVFGQVNDFLFPVFPGIFIAGTTAPTVLTGLPSLEVSYAASPYVGDIAAEGLPLDNDLQIQLFNTVGVSLEDNGAISGWLSAGLFGPESFLPTGEVVLWNAQDSLIADNLFVDQGIGLVLLQGDTSATATGNVVYGNVFETGITTPNEFPYQIGLEEYESGDTLANNLFATEAGVWSPDQNLWSGYAQTNLNTWNLPAAVPANMDVTVSGFTLGAGSVAGLPWVCGNVWDGAFSPYIAWTSPVPFNESGVFATGGDIASGGDACPAGPEGMVTYADTYTETGLTAGSWAVTDGDQTVTATVGNPITVQDPNGSWNYYVAAETGFAAAPSLGSNTISGAGQTVAVTFEPYSAPQFLLAVNETGLAAGTSWSITVTGPVVTEIGSSTTITSTASSISWTATAGSYSYTVNPVTDYTIATGGSGTLTVTSGSAYGSVTFTADKGTVSVTATPSSASVWVDGAAVTGTSGVFTSSVAPGIASVEVTATGYIPWFTNVSVAPGGTTGVKATLTEKPVAPPPVTHTVYNNNTGAGSLASTGGYEGIVIGLVVGVIVGIALAMLLSRKKTPSPATAPTASGAGWSPSTPSSPGEMHAPPGGQAPPNP